MKSFVKKFKEIYDGWKNDAFPTPEVLKFAEPRAKICAECPLNINGICSTNRMGPAVKDFEYDGEERKHLDMYPGCGCPLSKKTKSLTSQCPLGKW